MSVLSRPEFHNEEAAFSYLEGKLWTNGTTCPHCGGFDRITKVKANLEKRIRLGLYRWASASSSSRLRSAPCSRMPACRSTRCSRLST